MGIFAWFAATLRQYPEIAIFLTLAIGYYIGKFTFKGLGLGSVTATLLAGVLIGQIGITISQPLKATVFLLFLFAVGYGVGPQFVRGVAKDGVPQALFAIVQCVLCLAVPVAIVKLAGYDLGYAAGFYSGSQTISAAMGLSTDAINRLGLAADQAKNLLNSMPVAYAVTYMFGTVGSAIVIALLGPFLLRFDIAAACKDYEEKQGGSKELGGPGTAWHRWEVRAFRVQPGARVIGLRAAEAEALLPQARVFVQRIRRSGVIEEATADTVLREGDVVAVAGAREALVSIIGERAKLVVAAGGREAVGSVTGGVSIEVDDPELLSVPVEGVDVYVTNKAVDGKTLAELAGLPGARGRHYDPHSAEHAALPRRYRHPRRADPGHYRCRQAAGSRGPANGCRRRRVYRRRDYGRRTGRCAGVEGGRSAADAFDCGWRAHRRARARVVSLDAPVLREDSVAHCVVHELGRPQYLHRHSRHLGRPGLRERPADAGHQPVPVGGLSDHIASHLRYVHRQVHLPLP